MSVSYLPRPILLPPNCSPPDDYHYGHHYPSQRGQDDSEVPYSDFGHPLDTYWPPRDQAPWSVDGGSPPPTISIPPATIPPPPPSVISAESPDSFVDYQSLPPDAPFPPSRPGSVGPNRRRNSLPFMPVSPTPGYQPYNKMHSRKSATPPRPLHPPNKPPPNFNSMTPHQKSQFESDQRKRKTMFDINDLLLRNGIEVHGAPKQLQAFLNLYRKLEQENEQLRSLLPPELSPRPLPRD